MRCDVVVVGAGLAGLSAARDLAAAGTDVVVIEARGRAGGRVEQTQLDDGRLVQLGGELVGSFHTAYLGLVEELGLTIVPGFGERLRRGGRRRLHAGGRARGGQRLAVVQRRRSRQLRGDRSRVREARRERRSRRSLVAPGRRPARPDLGRGLDALRRRDRERGSRSGAEHARALGGVGGADLAPLRPSQGGRRGRARLLRLRGLGGGDGRGGLGLGGAADGGRARGPDPLRDAGYRDQDRRGRLLGRDRHRGALRVRRGRQRRAGWAAAPGRDRRGLGRSPAVTRSPAPRPGGQGRASPTRIRSGSATGSTAPPTWRRPRSAAAGRSARASSRP